MTAEPIQTHPANKPARSAGTRGNWIFALIAVALHGGLLMIPLDRAEPEARPGVIQLDLVTVLRNPEPLEIQPPEEPDVAGIVEEQIQETELPAQEPPPRLAVEQEETEHASAKDLTATVLLEQTRDLDILDPVEKKKELGAPGHTPLPAHWTTPIIAHYSGPFSEDFAPLEVDVLDQWQTPDGTIRVVMRTPSGHTLCGSLDAWDPMNPLFEPVPMYRKCAGGGRRKGR